MPCKVVWVLETAYRIGKSGIVSTLKNLVRARQLELEDIEVMHRALASHAAGKGDFADYLIRERAGAHRCRSR